MKKFVWLLFGICAAWGCTKHSGSATAPVVSAISYWDVGHHRVMNLAFSYDDTGRLVAYTDEIIDSVPAIEIEEQTFTFRYAPGSRVPTRYEVNDHANVPAYSTSATAPEGDYQLQYDKQGRLVTDSLTDTSALCCLIPQYSWNYSATGIGVYVAGSTGLFFVDTLTIQNGNVTSYQLPSLVYGDVQNPLYNSAIASSFGALFFIGVRPGFIGWWMFPTDFISRYLPVSQKGDWISDLLTFAWQVGSDGRVTGGTLTDQGSAGYGPVEIRFTYQ